VLEEIQRGDPEAADERLRAVSRFPLLPISPEVEHLAALYEKELRFPGRSLRDTLHLAVASVHAVDFLVTWNCKHIANAHIRRRLAALNDAEGILTPIICTPEELLDEDAIPAPDL
jgi:hypothetical protein